MTQGTEQETAPKSEASLDDIVEQSTIRLPEPLTIRETKKLLMYIAKNLPANINYQTSQHFSVYHAEKGLANEPGTFSISGRIQSITGPLAFDSFSSEHSATYVARISALRFSPIPGYEVEEHRPEVVKLWENVKTLAEAYFKSVHKK